MASDCLNKNDHKIILAQTTDKLTKYIYIFNHNKSQFYGIDQFLGDIFTTTLCARGRRTDTVEWLERKPCWLGERVNDLSSGYKRRCKTLTAGQRWEMGRLLVPKSADILGMGIVVLIACFQMAGILQRLIERL